MSILTIEQLRVASLTLDLEIGSGETVCLSGPSGSGKSLLLRAIADLIPHSGRVWLDREACDEMPAHLWRRQVGLLPAESQWWADRVGDHFEEIDQAAFTALGFSAEVLDWQLARCSTGEKQRLAILRLLSRRPRALLLDEPTASLDPDAIRRVEGLIDSYRQRLQAPVLWVSHDPAQLERVANRRLVIHDSRMEEQR